MRFCGLFGPLSKGNFRRKMMTIVGNHGQLWTSTLKPPFGKPPLKLSRIELVNFLGGGDGVPRPRGSCDKASQKVASRKGSPKGS